MRIEEIADDGILQALMASMHDPNRSPGLHLSDITGDISKQLDPKRFSGEMNPALLAAGNAFETVIARQLRLMFPGADKPGEFSSDGIAMSPDFLNPVYGCPEEDKMTWTSGRLGLDHPKLERYHRQGKSYCRVLGTDRILFRVLFVNGSYDTYLPVLRTFLVTYSTRELRENWEMILQHGEDMGVL